MTTNHEVAGSSPAADAWWSRPQLHARALTAVSFLVMRVFDAWLLAHVLRRLEQRDGWRFRDAHRLLIAVAVVAWNARVASERARRTLDDMEQLHTTLGAHRGR